MSDDTEGPLRYDRQLLLFGPKRNAVLACWEVQRFGADAFGDADYVSLYGFRPEEWYARGIRVLGRTAVECTPDSVALEIARLIAGSVPRDVRRVFVVDPFTGSGNTLHWILRELPGATGIGFELDPGVYTLTCENLSIIGAPIELVHDDYVHALDEIEMHTNDFPIVFVAPMGCGIRFGERSGSVRHDTARAGDP